eukprot:Gb_00463 [translate_table: standard]
MIQLLLNAVDTWENPSEMLLHQLRPHCIIHDFAQCWNPRLLLSWGFHLYFFRIFGGASITFVLSTSRGVGENIEAQNLTTPPPDYPHSPLRVRPFEARAVLALYQSKGIGIRFVDRVISLCVEGSCAIAINSFSQLKGKYLENPAEIHTKTGFSLQVLCSSSPQSKSRRQQYWKRKRPYCLQWLHDRAPRSVVYASMGSECFSSEEQIHALALGLEASHVPFLWALRFPRNNNDDVEKCVSAVLPEGLECRTRGRGIVIGRWAAQKEILGPSAEFIKVGVAIARDEEDRSFCDEDVCRAAKAVMGKEEGRERILPSLV